MPWDKKKFQKIENCAGSATVDVNLKNYTKQTCRSTTNWCKWWSRGSRWRKGKPGCAPIVEHWSWWDLRNRRWKRLKNQYIDWWLFKYSLMNNFLEVVSQSERNALWQGSNILYLGYKFFFVILAQRICIRTTPRNWREIQYPSDPFLGSFHDKPIIQVPPPHKTATHTQHLTFSSLSVISPSSSLIASGGARKVTVFISSRSGFNVLHVCRRNICRRRFSVSSRAVSSAVTIMAIALGSAWSTALRSPEANNISGDSDNRLVRCQFVWRFF